MSPHISPTRTCKGPGAARPAAGICDSCTQTEVPPGPNNQLPAFWGNSLATPPRPNPRAKQFTGSLTAQRRRSHAPSITGSPPPLTRPPHCTVPPNHRRVWPSSPRESHGIQYIDCHKRSANCGTRFPHAWCYTPCPSRSDSFSNKRTFGFRKYTSHLNLTGWILLHPTTILLRHGTSASTLRG